jgi:hypothetical protein
MEFGTKTFDLAGGAVADIFAASFSLNFQALGNDMPRGPQGEKRPAAGPIAARPGTDAIPRPF